MEELSTVEAQAQLARLIDRARKGQETVITDHGRPVARVSPVDASDVPSFMDWEAVWRRMRERANAAGVPPFKAEELKALRDEGRR